MTIEESYETIGDDLEDMDGLSLDELRAIRRTLGHDVEAEEQDFLAMLKERGLLNEQTPN